jgi:hypothetical protein
VSQAKRLRTLQASEDKYRKEKLALEKKLKEAEAIVAALEARA